MLHFQRLRCLLISIFVIAYWKFFDIYFNLFLQKRYYSIAIIPLNSKTLCELVAGNEISYGNNWDISLSNFHAYRIQVPSIILHARGIYCLSIIPPIDFIVSKFRLHRAVA